MIIKPFANSGGYTTFDNAIFDYVMPRCKPNTWKVLCIAIRLTRGWNKEQDRISLTQFQKLTGIGSRPTTIAAIQDAIASGYLICDESGMTHAYSLNINCEIETSKEIIPVDDNQYKNFTTTSKETKPKLVKKLNTQNTKEIKESISGSLIFTTYQNDIQMLTPGVANELNSLIDDYPEAWILGAIKIAVEQNKRSLAYIKGILRRQQASGRADLPGKKDTGGRIMPEGI